MDGALEGLTILIPESRELAVFATMLEAEGAIVVRCPLVRILDLEDTTEAEVWINQLISGTFEDVIWLTGEGLRRLLAIASRNGCASSFVCSLGRVRSITRGPKPARVLRELGFTPGRAAPEPTSNGILEALASEGIHGRSIGVQLYPGDATLPLVNALRERGASVFSVTPYRYAAEAETNQVLDVIHGLASGQIRMIAFTSSPQVERLMEIARNAGIEAELLEILRRVPIAAIGPVVEDTLHRCGIATTVRPETSFHLRPLVRAIVSAWNGR